MIGSIYHFFFFILVYMAVGPSFGPSSPVRPGHKQGAVWELDLVGHTLTPMRDAGAWRMSHNAALSPYFLKGTFKPNASD